jgi:transcriptional regulator with XRE-family HTH domain
MPGPAGKIPGAGDQRPRPLLRTMLGDVLRRARLEQGRTLADVASAAKVSMPYLSEVERGRKEASSEVLASICAALRIDLFDILATLGSEPIDGRARYAQIINLGAIRDRPWPTASSGSAQARCLLAA